ncbi:MAG: hypothetical protein PHD97_00185 [Bacteroidales bacterium]|nr:hypothetical protein [Bacteroidales bacterium]
MKSYKLIIALVIFSVLVKAQVINDSVKLKNNLVKTSETDNIETIKLFKRQNNFFIYWGYNRSIYSRSDVHFYGKGYDFKIFNAIAKDDPISNDPSPSFLTYIKPTTFTRPQYNFHFGYFLNNKNYVLFGIDHMGYKMIKQATHLTGTVNLETNKGNYNNTEVLIGEGNGDNKNSIIDSLPKGFVQSFEHCSGLNNVSFEFGRYNQIWISNNYKHAISIQGSVGIGMMLPNTESEVLGQPSNYNNESKYKSCHLAGYSLSASIGLQLDFYKHFFLQTTLKSGYINMPNINTTKNGGKASQQFYFLEPFIVVGYAHSLSKN